MLYVASHKHEDDTQEVLEVVVAGPAQGGRGVLLLSKRRRLTWRALWRALRTSLGHQVVCLQAPRKDEGFGWCRAWLEVFCNLTWSWAAWCRLLCASEMPPGVVGLSSNAALVSRLTRGGTSRSPHTV